MIYFSYQLAPVRIKYSNSEIEKITVGILQGSKMSTLIFNLYISDFSTTNKNHAERSLYLDDSEKYYNKNLTKLSMT